MTPARAEDIALGALAWLCAEEDLLGVFLAATGADVTALTEALRGADSALLLAVLDFIAQRDQTVIAACDAQALPYADFTMAQAVLSGAAQTHWT